MSRTSASLLEESLAGASLYTRRLRCCCALTCCLSVAGQWMCEAQKPSQGLSSDRRSQDHIQDRSMTAGDACSVV